MLSHLELAAPTPEEGEASDASMSGEDLVLNDSMEPLVEETTKSKKIALKKRKRSGGEEMVTPVKRRGNITKDGELVKLGTENEASADVANEKEESKTTPRKGKMQITIKASPTKLKMVTPQKSKALRKHPTGSPARKKRKGMSEGQIRQLVCEEDKETVTKSNEIPPPKIKNNEVKNILQKDTYEVSVTSNQTTEKSKSRKSKRYADPVAKLKKTVGPIKTVSEEQKQNTRKKSFDKVSTDTGFSTSSDASPMPKPNTKQKEQHNISSSTITDSDALFDAIAGFTVNNLKQEKMNKKEKITDYMKFQHLKGSKEDAHDKTEPTEICISPSSLFPPPLPASPDSVENLLGDSEEDTPNEEDSASREDNPKKTKTKGKRTPRGSVGSRRSSRGNP